jgi:hypothetical protein
VSRLANQSSAPAYAIVAARDDDALVAAIGLSALARRATVPVRV